MEWKGMGGAGARSPQVQDPPTITPLRVGVGRSRTAQCVSLMASPRLARVCGAGLGPQGKRAPDAPKRRSSKKEKAPVLLFFSGSAPSANTPPGPQGKLRYVFLPLDRLLPGTTTPRSLCFRLPRMRGNAKLFRIRALSGCPAHAYVR